MPLPPPVDEHLRLVRLRALAVLDTAPEPVFDSLTQLAANICGTPFALLGLIDTHGHATGDELLKIVAKRLVRLVRPTDAVARPGCDEFAVLLPGVQEVGQAGRIAQKIVDAARVPFALGGGIEVQIGASVGGALGQAVRGNWQRLIKAADRMLYEAKGAGRNGYAIDAGATVHR